MTVRYDGKTSGVGATLGTGYTYMGDGDGYNWALVADGDEVSRVSYAGSYHGYGGEVTVDATPDIVAKVAAKIRPAMADRMYGAIVTGWGDLKVGDMAEVVRGRKVPHGFIVKIAWMGPDRYSRYGTRVAFDDPITGERVFMDAGNVRKVIDETPYVEAAQTAWDRMTKMTDIDVVRMYYGIDTGRLA